MNSSMWLII